MSIRTRKSFFNKRRLGAFAIGTSGFTLLEVMIAVSLIAIALVRLSIGGGLI